ncbi:hypothetical protein H2200_007267 [Cladophialophora chaetospira]|uniref:Uncharacterized protein n=1 Tax=Cladophialophora chaetospira TaxID=386627 RepID=A0AA39CHB3_9EURO|nr:hypothetical protein H2200_007267 [Cladophialophora chaetospira]
MEDTLLDIHPRMCWCVCVDRKTNPRCQTPARLLPWTRLVVQESKPSPRRPQLAFSALKTAITLPVLDDVGLITVAAAISLGAPKTAMLLPLWSGAGLFDGAATTQRRGAAVPSMGASKAMFNVKGNDSEIQSTELEVRMIV